jgi:hypothetical protein
LFPEVPEDRGHFPGPYYRHFLQGLRHSPPTYVEDLLRPPIPEESLGLPSSPDGTIGRMMVRATAPPPRRPTELEGLNIGGIVLLTL